MRRRAFIAGLGSAAVWPRAARAEQAPKRATGFLNSTSPQGYGRFLAAFRTGLGEIGYSESDNLTIEYRWAEGDYRRLIAMAADLVARRVEVIAATTTPANVIAMAATKTIPVVFTTSSDPVELGLVASLNRPGANVTGAVTLNVEVGPKRLELLRDAIPGATVVGALLNPNRPGAEDQARTLQSSSQALGARVLVLRASSESEIEHAFAQLADHKANALVVNTDAFFFSSRDRIIARANALAIPCIFDRREFAEAGGLMSYGGSATDIYRLAGNYVGRILNGETPAEMPVQQSTKLELLINLKAAKTLGVSIPTSLLATADEVIE